MAKRITVLRTAQHLCRRYINGDHLDDRSCGQADPQSGGLKSRFVKEARRVRIQLARGKKENVFVLSIPDYSVTPFAAFSDTARIRLELDWFNAINRSVTVQFQCAWLDITPSTREALYDLNLLASDRLHPSKIEYRKWAVRLMPLVQAVVR